MPALSVGEVYYPDHEMLFYVRINFAEPLSSVKRAMLENIWNDMVGADAHRRMMTIWREASERSEHTPVGQGSEDGVRTET